MKSDYTDILYIQFCNEISHREIASFRGAVLHSMESCSVLFHNHLDDKFRYAYPLIQYKRIKGRAAMLCLNQGTIDVGELFSSNVSFLQINDRGMRIAIEKILPRKIRVQAWDQSFSYRVANWLPLNSSNYAVYIKCKSNEEKNNLLEKVLTGNILSFAKGLGMRLDKEVKCKITSFSESSPVRVKNTLMQPFQAVFTSNVSLPDYIGLGKHASINYGVVTRIKNKTE